MASGLTGRVAVVHPYWDFWADSTPFDLERSREGLLADAVARIATHAEVVWSGLVDADRLPAVAGQLRDAAPDVVVVAQSMATPPAVTSSLLVELGAVPLVVWALRAEGAVRARFDHADVTSEGATVGTPMLTSLLVRAGRPFDLLTRPLADARLDVELGAAIRAAVAAAHLARARIGRVGSPIDGYACVDLDVGRLGAEVGPTIVGLDPLEYLEAYRSVGAAEVATAIDSVRGSHRVATDVIVDELERAVRCHLALEQLVADHRLDAGAFNCHVPEIRLGAEIGIAPCFALGCATSAGVPWTCSGDVVTAVAMLAVKQLGGPALYHELEAFDQGTGVFVLANTGEHDAGLAPGVRPEIVADPWYPGPPRSLCARLSPGPGPGTLVAFVQLDQPGGHRFVVAPGKFVAEGYPATGTANAAFRFRGDDPAESWRRWCLAGANHHGVATTGDLLGPLERVVAHLGVGVSPI